MDNTRPSNKDIDSLLQKEFKVLNKGFVRVIDYMGVDSSIVQAARVSYGSGTKTVSTDTGLIRYLLKHRHTTPFEMCEIKLHIKAPIFVARQWLRHRTANVNEYSARYSVMEEDYHSIYTHNQFPIPFPEQYIEEYIQNYSPNSKTGDFD